MISVSLYKDAAAVSQRLKRRHTELREEIRNTLLRANSERYANIADQLNDAEDQSLAELLADVSNAEVARDLDEVRDIEGALGRLTAGTYGQCVSCGTTIPAARLDAYPTAKRCLPCQQQHERERRGR